MADKSGVVNLRYELDNSQALAALRAIADEHSRIASLLAKSTQVGAPVSASQSQPGPATSSWGTSRGMSWGSSWASGQAQSVQRSQQIPLTAQSAPSASGSNLIVHALGRVNATIQRGNSLLVQINTRLAGRSGSGFGGDRHGDGAGDGAHPSGMNNALTRQAVRMAFSYMIYHIASEIPGQVANIANIRNRNDLTEGQKARGIAEELPVIGKIIGAGIRIADALDGTTERIRRAMVNIEVERTATQGALRYNTTRDQLLTQYSGASGTASALRRLQPRLVGANDRSTFPGQIAYEEAEVRRQGQIGVDVATARHEGSREEVKSASQQVQEARREVASLRARQDTLRSAVFQAGQTPGQAQAGQGGGFSGGVFGGVGAIVGAMPGASGAVQAVAQSQAPLADAQAALLNNTEALLAAEDRLRQAVQRRADAMRQAGATQQQIDQARINALQGELKLLQQREQRMTQGAQNLGMMNPIDREISMNAFRFMRDNGFENTPQFMRDQAMQIAPNTVRANATRFGENSAEFRELQAAGEFGDQPGAQAQSIQQVREAIDRMANQISTAQLESLQTNANAQLTAINGTLTNILASLNRVTGLQQEQGWITRLLRQFQGQQ